MKNLDQLNKILNLLDKKSIITLNKNNIIEHNLKYLGLSKKIKVTHEEEVIGMVLGIMEYLYTVCGYANDFEGYGPHMIKVNDVFSEEMVLMVDRIIDFIFNKLKECFGDFKIKSHSSMGSISHFEMYLLFKIKIKFYGHVFDEVDNDDDDDQYLGMDSEDDLFSREKDTTKEEYYFYQFKDSVITGTEIDYVQGIIYNNVNHVLYNDIIYENTFININPDERDHRLPECDNDLY